ncbi:hypothetical protein KCP74_03635 [Salmonella enterica subsp. enterica]|nr:hypothetical protein KCP74_03635 [Salmonella enterica subsp. enterica]
MLHRVASTSPSRNVVAIRSACYRGLSCASRSFAACAFRVGDIVGGEQNLPLGARSEHRHHPPASVCRCRRQIQCGRRGQSA